MACYTYFIEYFVGVIAGVIPSYRASLDPIDALDTNRLYRERQIKVHAKVFG